MNWLALRAWIALVLAVAGAALSLVLCYRRTMRKTIEQPDLVPSARGPLWTLPLGSSLQTAILQFSFRTLVRSRHHRVALAASYAIVLAIALAMLHGALAAHGPRPVDDGFLIPTFLMMALAVVGLRGVFALPVALQANWVLRLTQLRPTRGYLIGTRAVLVAFAVLPVWAGAALFSLTYRPWLPAAAHLVLLALFGLGAAELALIGFAKLPFTCSYLPGKSNVQFVFWGLLGAFVLLSTVVPMLEGPALVHLNKFLISAGLYALAALLLGLYNRARERHAQLYFEELPEQPILTLGLKIDPASQRRESNQKTA